jgi:secreted trypsin-like serine protease
MKIHAFLVILVATSVVSQANELASCGLSIDGVNDGIIHRIWGGTQTKSKAYPWLTVFTYTPNKPKFFCAGSLISAKHVVSGNEREKVLHESQTQKISELIRIVFNVSIAQRRTAFRSNLFSKAQSRLPS